MGKKVTIGETVYVNDEAFVAVANSGGCEGCAACDDSDLCAALPACPPNIKFIEVEE